MELKLEPGMIFCSKNPMWLGRAINGIQTFWDVDNKSEYSHSGIITSKLGGTFESLWTIRRSLIDNYKGQKVLIGRHKLMNQFFFDKGMKSVLCHKGQWYPFWRLIFHMIPPIAKYISSGAFPVCSELAMKFLCGAGMADNWKGWNPNNVADMIRKWDDWEVVFEDVL